MGRRPRRVACSLCSNLSRRITVLALTLYVANRNGGTALAFTEHPTMFETTTRRISYSHRRNVHLNAYHPDTSGNGGDGFWRPEIWERVNLVDDTIFWDRIHKQIYDGGVRSDQLQRFEGFCDNYRASPEESIATDAGQLLCPLGNFPGLMAKPIHELHDLPWAIEFEQRCGVISAEFRAFERMQAGHGWKGRDHAAKHWAGSNFKKVSLAVERVYKPDVKKYFTGTMRIVEDLDLMSMREVAFNMQAPGTGLIRHSDKFNYMLTGHLGITIPAGDRSLVDYDIAKEGYLCGIEIGGTVKTWEEEKLLVIDNSFMHHTWNDSPSESRVIFYFDFWHPDLTEEEKRALVIFRRAFKERSLEKEKERLESAKALDRLFCK